MASRRAWGRFLLAGPLAIVVALAVMLAMPVWMPAGAGGIDHIIGPALLLPLVWAALFFYACLDARPWRVLLVSAALLAVNAGLVAHHLLHQPTRERPAP